jgi:serine/threonine protein kinase
LDRDDPLRVGPYTLLARLGVGATGTAYLGRSAAGRTAAVKVLRAGLADDPGFRARFRAEAASARAVSGASTARVLDADPDGEPPWVATAFVLGVPLSRAVAERGQLPEPVLFALAAGLAHGLLIRHGAGLIHRGLNPGRVLLAADRPHLIEVGVAARACLEPGAASSADPGFLAPEQVLGRSLTPAADLFSLGSALYYAAAGRPPFGTGTPEEVRTRVAKASPVLGFLPPALVELLGACLAKDPNARATARQVLDFVERRAPAPPDTVWPPPVLLADIEAVGVVAG